MLQVSIQKQLEAFALQVSFVLASRGITVLWGASGSGKTTLLQCLAGLLRPDAGRIACREAVWFDAEQGVCLAPERRRIGYVFQDVRLFPHLSVRSNMLFGRRFRGPSGVSFEDVVALLGLGRLNRCLTVYQAACPEAKNSVSPWGAPCWPVPSCCSWMNR